MAHRSLTTWLAPVFAGLFLLSGCSRTLVKDEIHVAKTSGNHCSGSEGVDDSSLAVLPIPVVAFFVPHWDLNEVKADDFLRRCGDAATLVNRKVEVNKAACIPAGITRIISLGIWQWCPARVSWEADQKA